MIRKIINYIEHRNWIKRGKPVVKYEGYNCGCCGTYWNIPFEIPEYDSEGKYWDTWGMCPIGKGCNIS